MKIFNSERTFIFILFCTFLIISISSIILKPDFPLGDGNIYSKIAETMISDHTFPIIDGQIHKPGYPFFLATIYSIFGKNYNYVFFIQFILLFFTSLTIFRIGKNFFNFTNIQAFLTSFIVIAWPYLILYSSLLLTEMLYTFLLTASFYFFLKCLREQNLTNITLLSLFLALATLTRPIPMLLPFWLLPIIIFILYIKKNKKLKRYILTSITAALIFFVFLSPWIIYASNKTGKFTPIASNGSIAFRKANVAFSKEIRIYKTPGYEAGGAWTWEKLIKSKLRNTYRFWKSGAEGYHVDMLAEKHPITKYLIILYRVGFYVIVALGLSSVYFINKKKEIFLLWLIISYIWAVHIALFPYPRLTLPVMPIMFVLALYSAITYWSLYKGKMQKA